MSKKDFTNAGALPQNPTSEEVFTSMLEAEPEGQEPSAEEAPSKGKARRYGKPKGHSGHKTYCLWLTPKAMEGAKVLAKVRDKKLSVIVDEALTEYLDKPENARLVRKYKKAFLEEPED